MAKKSRKRASKELTRKQRSRLERERRMERIIKWSFAAVAVIVVGVLVYGLVVESFIKTRESVATVAGTPITTAEFQARVRFSRMQMATERLYMLQQQAALDPTNPDIQVYLEYIQGNIRELEAQLSPENALILGEQALDQLIQEELVRQEAERRGITVPPEDLDMEIEQFFGYDRNPVMPTVSLSSTVPLTPTDVAGAEPTTTPLPSPTPMSKAEFDQRYEDFTRNLRELKITEQQYRYWVESSLLMEKLQEQMLEESPTRADQVKLRYLTIDDQERASEAAARWNAGEDFEALLEELREDEEITAFGSEIDWLPKDALGRRFDALLTELVWSMPVGELSEPVLSQDGTGYTIVEVLGHEERELDDYFRRQATNQAFQEWLDGQQELVVRGTYRDRVPTEP